MKARPGLGFKVWTAFLSVFVAVILYPSIVGKHGVAKSLLITALAIAAIWLMYVVIGRVLNGVVAKELKRRSRERQAGPPDTKE